MKSPFLRRFGMPSPFFDNEAGFSPSILLTGSTAFAWYDPSDLSTMFQNSAGTTPVTAPAQPVGLVLDKSQGLVLGPELVTNGDFSSGSTGWTATGSATLSVVSGRLRVENSTTTTAGVTQIINTVAGKTYLWTYYVDPATSGGAVIRVRDGGTLTVISTATRTVAGTYSLYFVATSSTTQINCINSSSTVGAYHEIDNISVRELPGNHATQSTAASRPTYAIVPSTGRRNLLTFTEDFSNAVWSKLNQGTGVAPVLTSGFADPDGGNTAWRLQLNAGSNGSSDYSLVRQSSVGWPDTGTRSIWLRSNTGSNQTVTLVATQSTNRVTVTPTWQRFEQVSGSGSKQLDISVGGTGATGATADILIWRPQFEAGSTASPYQRVASQFDVTEAGVPSLSYLSFDGVDDFLQTSTITPNADKVQVFAGVRKLSDAALGMVAEYSANVNTNNGSWYLLTPTSAGVAGSGFLSKGTIASGSSATGFAAPASAVISGIGGIAGDTSLQRRNGAQVSQAASDQGTGNYLAYPLYIGRRGGTSLPFNGQLYGLITRFSTANLDASVISQTERWMGGKTGVTI